MVPPRPPCRKCPSLTVFFASFSTVPVWCLSLSTPGKTWSVFLSHCSVLSAEDIVGLQWCSVSSCLPNELNSIWDVLIICWVWPCLKWAHFVGCKQKCHLKDLSLQAATTISASLRLFMLAWKVQRSSTRIRKEGGGHGAGLSGRKITIQRED